MKTIKQLRIAQEALEVVIKIQQANQIAIEDKSSKGLALDEKQNHKLFINLLDIRKQLEWSINDLNHLL